MVIGSIELKWWVADRQGFEPWRRSPAYTLSRRAPSTTRPPVRGARFSPIRPPFARPNRYVFAGVYDGGIWTL